jgi:retinol dehydrogenase 12
MRRLGNLTGSNSAAFNFEDNMPSLQGKVIFITGCDSGIGKQAITYLAQLSPSEIWLAVRSLDQADVTVANVRRQMPAAKLQTLQLDLASFSSIKGVAAAFLAQTKRLDLLILNAGVMGTVAMRTEDGYEHQFGINYMGHALLTKLLMPALLQTAETAESQSDVRVIITTSYSHRNAPSGGICWSMKLVTSEGQQWHPSETD